MSDEKSANWRKWRGLEALIHDAVEHGSRAVERVHLETARRPFAILEQVPGIAGPTKVVHVLHDSVVTSSYAAVRWVNGLVGKAGKVVLDMAEQAEATSSKPEAE